MLDNKQEGTVSQRPLTATDSGWGLQCQDCKPHGGGEIEGKATTITQMTQVQGLGDCCHLHRQCLREGKTHRGWTDKSRNTQSRTETGQAWTIQSGLSRQALTQSPGHAEPVAERRIHKIVSGELSSDKRSLNMSVDWTRQYVWEGVCMLNNNRYQNISIGIHTQTGGGTRIHIVIGVEAGAIDSSHPTCQTGYDANRIQRSPLNHHREYTLGSPRCSQSSISRDQSPGLMPDHDQNHTGQLTPLHPGKGETPSAYHTSRKQVQGA